MHYHLAQVNVARMVAPLDSPELAPFVARLDAVNAEADRAPGFVWRLLDEGRHPWRVERRRHAGDVHLGQMVVHIRR